MFDEWISYFKKWEKNNFEEDFCKVRRHFVLKYKKDWKFEDIKDTDIEDIEIVNKK